MEIEELERVGSSAEAASDSWSATFISHILKL